MKTAAILAAAFSLACSICHADTDAPIVTSFTVTPDPVDITTGSQTLTVSLHITDDASGFSFGTLDLYNPSLTLVANKFFAGSSRTSGNSLEGDYQFTVSIPAYSQPGNWMLQLMVRDSSSQVRFYGPGQTNYPGPSGPYMTVVNTGPVDTAAPVIVSQSITPSTFDSSSGDTVVTLGFHITDTLAGFDHGIVTFYDPNGNPGEFLNPYFNIRASGTEFDGTYQVNVLIPQGSMPGGWTYQVQLFDKIGNTDWMTDGTFTITGGGPTDYASYVASHGLTGGDALVGADPDHDELPCGLEFLLGTDPTTATDAAGKFWHDKDATHLHLNLLINSSLPVAANGGFLEVGGGAQPFHVTGQTQAILGGSWNDSLPQQVSGNHYRVSLPLSAGKGFIRLKLEQP